MENSKKALLLVFALVVVAVLLVMTFLMVITGTVCNMATQPHPVPRKDRVAFWLPYIQNAVQTPHGLKDPIQLVDSIIEMGSTGNPIRNASDGKAVGLMWIPSGAGGNLDDPQTNITTGVGILGAQTGQDNQAAAEYWFARAKEKPTTAYVGYSNRTIFDVWVGNGAQASDGSNEYQVDGDTATVLAIAQGPDGTQSSSVLSANGQPVQWPTIRLPNYVQPAVPAGAKTLPEWAREVTWSQTTYGPADPSSGNYLLYPGMYVYQIEVTAKNSSVTKVTIPFEAVWAVPGPKGKPEQVYAQPQRSITIDFGWSGKSVSGGGSSNGGGSQPVPVIPSKNLTPLIEYAKQFLGVPYVWGGRSPSGFDCSGFVWYVFNHFGIDVPPPTFTQYTMGVPVSKSDLQTGDLVFFQTYTVGPSHVGIYIGNGLMIDAEDLGVCIDDINNSYWAPLYYGARRIVHGTGG